MKAKITILIFCCLTGILSAQTPNSLGQVGTVLSELYLANGTPLTNGDTIAVSTIYNSRDSLGINNGGVKMDSAGTQNLGIGHFPNFPTINYTPDEYGFAITPDATVLKKGNGTMYMEDGLWSYFDEEAAAYIEASGNGISLQKDKSNIQINGTVGTPAYNAMTINRFAGGTQNPRNEMTAAIAEQGSNNAPNGKQGWNVYKIMNGSTKSGISYLWNNGTDGNDVELYNKYQLPNAQPATTNGTKSIMTWTGDGSATTPSFEPYGANTIFNSRDSLEIPNGGVKMSDQQTMYIGQFQDINNGPYSANDMGFYMDKNYDGGLGLVMNSSSGGFCGIGVYPKSISFGSVEGNYSIGDYNSIGPSNGLISEKRLSIKGSSIVFPKFTSGQGFGQNQNTPNSFSNSNFIGVGERKKNSVLEFISADTATNTAFKRIVTASQYGREFLGLDTSFVMDIGKFSNALVQSNLVSAGNQFGRYSQFSNLGDFNGFRVGREIYSPSNNSISSRFDWLRIYNTEIVSGNNIEFYEKYRLPNAQPSTTNNIVTGMKWSGDGSTVTPSMDTLFNNNLPDYSNTKSGWFDKTGEKGVQNSNGTHASGVDVYGNAVNIYTTTDGYSNTYGTVATYQNRAYLEGKTDSQNSSAIEANGDDGVIIYGETANVPYSYKLQETNPSSTNNTISIPIQTGNGSAAIPSWQVQPKKYVALITQTGTNDPVATVLENTLGGTVVWTRDGIGYYSGRLTGAFTANKTIGFCVVDLNYIIGTHVIGGRESNNVFAFGSYDNSGAQVDLEGPMQISITVYP